MEINLVEFLAEANERNASDIYIITGKALSMKAGGEIIETHKDSLTPADTQKLMEQIYHYAGRDGIAALLENGDDDFSFSLPGVARFRVSAYRQRGTLAAVIRLVPFGLPDPEKYGIPRIVIEQAERTKGLVLVAGPTASGKTTTLACMIEKINQSRNAHIITIEDPIEFLYKHNKSIVSQRELNLDTKNYAVALRAALRQAPNVILLGEMRDAETIDTAMTAAETGHLVFSTLHTVGAANTIDRIVDAFPPKQQDQIRMQISMTLEAVISQQLVPKIGGGITAVFEVMIANDAIRNLIREGKTHQIDSVITSSTAKGMATMDSGILKLFQEGIISRATALSYATQPELMRRRIAAV